MVKEVKCVHCQKKDGTDDDSAADIEYMDSEFSLVVSSKNIKHSKQIFNELFDKVKTARAPKKNSYIG